MPKVSRNVEESCCRLEFDGLQRRPCGEQRREKTASSLLSSIFLSFSHHSPSFLTLLPFPLPYPTRSRRFFHQAGSTTLIQACSTPAISRFCCRTQSPSPATKIRYNAGFFLKFWGGFPGCRTRSTLMIGLGNWYFHCILPQQLPLVLLSVLVTQTVDYHNQFL